MSNHGVRLSRKEFSIANLRLSGKAPERYTLLASESDEERKDL
jgi:hypothetical protein